MEAKSVRFESDFEQGGFTAVPNFVLADAALSVQARLTYALLRFYAWQDESCWPGQKALSELIGCSERSLRAYLTELAVRDLVRVERRGMGLTNLYILVASDRKPASGQDRQRASDQDRQPASGPVEEDSVKEDSITSHQLGEQIREVFDHWRTKMIHPRAKLDSSRRSKITARLKDGFSVEDLKLAIDGCAASAWHMGENPSNKRFDDIALICRDAQKVEGFMVVDGSMGSGNNWDKLLEGGNA
jgi:hypothetical protein